MNNGGSTIKDELKEVLKEVHDLEDKLRDRFLSSRSTLWNSIITVNGILISSFSIFSLLSQQISKVVIGTILISCFVSLTLCLYNQYFVKELYLALSIKLLNPENKVAQDNVEKVKGRRDTIILFENISMGLLFMVFLIVLILVYSAEPIKRIIAM